MLICRSRAESGCVVAEHEARIERAGTGANAWIIGDDEEVIVIDPGEDAQAVLTVVGEREVLAVICTHGHAPHVAAAPEVAEKDEAPVALHPADRMHWRDAHSDDDPDIDMEDGGIFEIAGVSLEVMAAPGHSPGSVCLYCEDLNAVFAGDVLSATGPVPYEGEFPDFPGQLSAIGEHLLTLPGETRVLPAHGRELTIARVERRFDSWVSAGPKALLIRQEEGDEPDDDEPGEDSEPAEDSEPGDTGEDSEDSDAGQDSEDGDTGEGSPDGDGSEDGDDSGTAEDSDTGDDSKDGQAGESGEDGTPDPEAAPAAGRNAGRGRRLRRGRRR